MPEISRFLGISIRMYRDEHLPPHFHAIYNEFAVQISIRPPLSSRVNCRRACWVMSLNGQSCMIGN